MFFIGLITGIFGYRYNKEIRAYLAAYLAACAVMERIMSIAAVQYAANKSREWFVYMVNVVYYIQLCFDKTSEFEIVHSALILHPFYYKSTLYKIPIRVRKGPKLLMHATGFSGDAAKDVTEDVRALAGPREDFFGSNLTPFDMGYDKIILEVSPDAIKIFGESDILVI